MKKLLLFLGIVFMFFSCLNYIPCRGQDYIIEEITHQDLIDKFKELRYNYPEYYTNQADRINEEIPHYYLSLDLNGLIIHCDIHIGNKIPEPPTHLTFTSFYDSTICQDINSKELDKEKNEKYKKRFETEILYKLGVKWKRKSCW